MFGRWTICKAKKAKEKILKVQPQISTELSLGYTSIGFIIVMVHNNYYKKLQKIDTQKHLGSVW
mgnify:CR=1 FL=1